MSLDRDEGREEGRGERWEGEEGGRGGGREREEGGREGRERTKRHVGASTLPPGFITESMHMMCFQSMGVCTCVQCVYTAPGYTSCGVHILVGDAVYIMYNNKCGRQCMAEVPNWYSRESWLPDLKHYALSTMYTMKLASKVGVGVNLLLGRAECKPGN